MSAAAAVTASLFVAAPAFASSHTADESSIFSTTLLPCRSR